jgi:hypothetical protein
MADFQFDLDHYLRALDASQLSIEQTSSWLSRLHEGMDAPTQVQLVVDTWCRYLLRVQVAKKIAFVYLANDLITKSLMRKQKGSCVLDYHLAFEPCIMGTLELLFEIYEAHFEMLLSIVKVVQVWINKSVFDAEKLALLKRSLMLKAAITQDNLDGKPRDTVIVNGLRLNDLHGQEVPQVLLELAQAAATLREHRVAVKQQEVELAHSAVTSQQVHKLEALYTLEKAYQM